MMDILIHDLSVSFPSSSGTADAVRHVNLSLPAGKITALVGESGSGKSILGAAIMGLLEEEAHVTGQIMYNNSDLLQQSEREWNLIRGKEIGWIAQDPITAMDPMQRVGRQMTELIRYVNHTTISDERPKAIEQLSRFGLENAESVYQKYPNELSGGMAQRALSAMVTLPKPGWLIADEPTKGLDAFVRREVCRLFRMLRDEEGVGFLLVTHDIRLAEKVSDYTGIMYAGELLEYGSTQEVFQNPRHPYTIDFLEAQPRHQLKPIPGMPPNLNQIPQGCIFKNRCRNYLVEICDKRQTMQNLTDNHQVQCGREVMI